MRRGRKKEGTLEKGMRRREQGKGSEKEGRGERE